MTGAVLLAACSATPAPSVLPSAHASASEAPDATIDGLVAILSDPSWSGTAQIGGTFTSFRSGSQPVPISGELAFSGEDAATALKVESFAFHRQTTVGSHTYVLGCGYPTCGPPIAYWTDATELGVPPSVIVLARDVTSLRHDDAQTWNGRELQRLVPVAQPTMSPETFGLTQPFGEPDPSIANVEGSLAFLVADDGAPVAILVALTWMEFDQRAELNIDFTLDAATAAIEAPPASDILRRVQADGYILAVPADWTFEPGATDGYDRFLAPAGSAPREIRLYRTLQPEATYWEGSQQGAILITQLEEDYGGSVEGQYGGFGGSINVNGAGLSVEIDGQPVFVLGGPIFWAGPEGCPADQPGCIHYWSRMDLLSTVDGPFDPQSFINVISGNFREHLAP